MVPLDDESVAPLKLVIEYADIARNTFVTEVIYVPDPTGSFRAVDNTDNGD
jgi:hypothetical protein